jgi:hypothetical protein
MFKEAKMTGLRMISRTSWVALCGTAAMAAAVFVTCGGPTPLDGSLSNPTAKGGQNASGGNGGNAAPIIRGIGGNTGSVVGTAVPDVSEADGGNCGLTTANLTKQPADLLLVLDKTGSMTSSIDSTSDCQNPSTDPDAGQGCQQRWATMVSGLNAVLSGSSGDVNWGLQLFNSDGNCGVATSPEVPIAPGSAATVQTTIAGVTPNGATPTRAAITAAVAYLQGLGDTNGKYILLATDGEPNCLTTGGGGGRRGGGGGTGASDVQGTVDAITAASAAGIKVYVIGVGPETGNLDNFATAGGTDHYYPALSPQDLNAALATIVGTVASCTFNLGTAPQDPTNVVVQFNGDKGLRAPHDTGHTEGWDYTSSKDTTIQLYGKWCDNVTNGTYTSAMVLKGCPGQINF